MLLANLLSMHKKQSINNFFHFEGYSVRSEAKSEELGK